MAYPPQPPFQDDPRYEPDPRFAAPRQSRSAPSQHGQDYYQPQAEPYWPAMRPGPATQAGQPPSPRAAHRAPPHASSRQAPPANYQRGQRAATMTAAEKFWYVLGCIPFAAMYMCKVPAKKALADLGECELTAAEQFWYALMCISFGAGYFAKVPIKKALSEARGGGYR